MTLPMKPALWCPGIRQGHPLARGLVAAWPWAGTANLRDVVGNHHMTAYNTPTVSSDEFGRVVAFDDGSTQYLEVNKPAVKDYPLTMACWFRSDDLTIDQCLMCVGKSIQLGYGVYLLASGDQAGDPVRAGRAAYGGFVYTSTSSGYSANVWHQAVGLYASSTVTYACIDGGNKGGGGGATKAALQWGATIIGNTSETSQQRYMSGRIAFPLIWSRVLSDLEVRWLYEEPWSLITPRKRTYFWVAASVAGGAALEKALSDSLTIADARTAAVAMARADSLALADARLSGIALGRTESLAIADALAKAMGLSRSEVLSLADSLAKAIGLGRTDTISIADLFTTDQWQFKALSDTVSIADGLANAISISRSDVLSLADSLAKTMALGRTDTIAITDVFSSGQLRLLALLAVVGQGLVLTGSTGPALTLTPDLQGGGEA